MDKPIYTFSHNYGKVKVEHTIETFVLETVIEEFERFLLGCGFVFDGYLEIVDDSEKE